MTPIGNGFTCEDAIALLERIARDEGNDAEERVYALEVLARLNGWNQPLKLQLVAADFQTILEQLAKLSPVAESAARRVEIEGVKIHHFLDARRALSDCRRAVGMAHVQRPESEPPRSDPQFT